MIKFERYIIERYFLKGRLLIKNDEAQIDRDGKY